MATQERWLVVVILLVITAITRPDIGSFNRFIARAAENRGGILAGLLTRAATLVGYPSSVTGKLFVGIWGTWLPWYDWDSKFNPSEWTLSLPRCRRCQNGNIY
ncbi:hypothetical protein HDU67_006661 [Dinochytrium kinnereticum]|nr:hypothetical protein HDU67_006661 [Dinochytrium kinnereticum]